MQDVFKDTEYGKKALEIIQPEDENFKLYEVTKADDYGTLKVTGGIFREALSGKYKGKFNILVKDTSISVYVNIRR